jgi:hypothetical protein
MSVSCDNFIKSFRYSDDPFNSLYTNWNSLTPECKSKLTSLAWISRKHVKPSINVDITNPKCLDLVGYNVLTKNELTILLNSNMLSKECKKSFLTFSELVIKNNIRDRQTGRDIE